MYNSLIISSLTQTNLKCTKTQVFRRRKICFFKEKITGVISLTIYSWQHKGGFFYDGDSTYEILSLNSLFFSESRDTSRDTKTSKP